MKSDRIHPGDQFGMLTVLGRDMFDYIMHFISSLLMHIIK